MCLLAARDRAICLVPRAAFSAPACGLLRRDPLMLVNADPVDLTNCDREPIHTPGSVQPYGCLLACDGAVGIVRRHSLNAGTMLGLGDEDLNGRRLDDLIGEQAAHDLRNALARWGNQKRAG